jgi:RHS repeat-associated protein
MTATAATASRKLASRPSTWRRRANIRRARKLDRESRPTNGSNIFRWYRPGWGRYTQADPLGPLASDTNLFRYALSAPTRFIDLLGLDVRICCRNFNAVWPLNTIFDHCYIESNRNGRRTWGLYGRDVTLPDNTTRMRLGIPDVNDRSDRPTAPGTQCGPWYPDCSGCLDRAMQNYPTEDYSEWDAPRGQGTGRNSNTFVRCMLRRCGLGDANGATREAAGYDQPCPSGF